MWQMIAKAACGALGGGMKAAADSGKTNLGGSSQTSTKTDEQTASDIGSGIGSIAGKMFSKFGSKGGK